MSSPSAFGGSLPSHSAGAGAAAVAEDAGHQVIERGLHEAFAHLGVDDVLRAVVLDVGDLRHGDALAQALVAVKG
jgi:hypothetical protein